jgi:hypothetical protein
MVATGWVPPVPARSPTTTGAPFASTSAATPSNSPRVIWQPPGFSDQRILLFAAHLLNGTMEKPAREFELDVALQCGMHLDDGAFTIHRREPDPRGPFVRGERDACLLLEPNRSFDLAIRRLNAITNVFYLSAYGIKVLTLGAFAQRHDV